MTYIAICDDDFAQIKNTEKLIRRIAEHYDPEIELFPSGDELLKAIANSDYCPDLAVLDINMPGSSGIDVAKRLNVLCPDCSIIYLTTYLNYATDVYETRHSYFVLKSEMEERMDAAIAKALENSSCSRKLSFREDGSIKTVCGTNVLYLERKLKKTRIVCQNKLHSTYMKAEELLENTGCRFIKCHQSYWVNLEKVTGMTAESFIMENGDSVPISRSHRKEAKEAFLSLLNN